MGRENRPWAKGLNVREYDHLVYTVHIFFEKDKKALRVGPMNVRQ